MDTNIIKSYTLLGLIIICSYLIVGSYNNIYDELYLPQDDLANLLAPANLVGTEYVTQEQLLLVIIEALNIVICLIAITVSFQSLTRDNNIRLLNYLK